MKKFQEISLLWKILKINEKDIKILCKLLCILHQKLILLNSNISLFI